MTTEPTSKLLWADKVTATKTEAALAHLIHTAVQTTIPKNWRTLPTGKPTAEREPLSADRMRWELAVHDWPCS